MGVIDFASKCTCLFLLERKAQSSMYRYFTATEVTFSLWRIPLSVTVIRRPLEYWRTFLNYGRTLSPKMWENLRVNKNG